MIDEALHCRTSVHAEAATPVVGTDMRAAWRSTRKCMWMSVPSKMQAFATALLLIATAASGCRGAGPSVQIEAPRNQVDVHIEIDEPPGGQVHVPVEIDAAALRATDPVVVLGGADAREAVVLQAAPALWHAPDTSRLPDETAYCGVLPAEFRSGAYDIRSGSAPVAFTFSEEDGRLMLKEDGRPVLAYNFWAQLSDGLPEENARSSYIHPIWGLDGTPITDDFPADHLHHRGLSWMWPRVFHEGSEYDVWALKGMEQVFDEWLFREAGPGCATIGVKNFWQLMDGERNVVDEWVWVRVYPAGDRGRAIDIRITLEAREPVEIAGRETDDKGYGGFSFRFAPREPTVIVSSSGLEAEDSDDKRLPWADQSGRFGGSDAFSGVAIFQHADHPDFPARWTLRHYGFLGVAWPGVERRALRPGEPVTLRYRVWIHRGDAEEGVVADAYEAFARPPFVRAAN